MLVYTIDVYDVLNVENLYYSSPFALRSQYEKRIKKLLIMYNLKIINFIVLLIDNSTNSVKFFRFINSTT